MNLSMHPETATGTLKAGSHTLPLQEMDVRGHVHGLLYSATVKQTFRNDRDERLEAVYVFPLPPKAAVHGFRLTIGDRVIEGVIQERAQARKAYQAAIQKGHRAALMEEERSDVFTTTVGNIGPDEEVTISFELSGPLSCFGNTARLRFPLVVAEVYVPGDMLAGPSVGSGTTTDTDLVPDASRITPPRLASGADNPVKLSLNFEVEGAGLKVDSVESTCHFARIKKSRNGNHRVSLLPGVERLDKAFVMELKLAEDSLQTSLLVDRVNQVFALTVVPPRLAEKNPCPRDLMIVLDRSGSMDGWNMVAARQAAARIVESLTPEDSFGIIAFDTTNEHFHRGRMCPADAFFKMKASEFLRKVEARGGTEVCAALQAAHAYFDRDNGRDAHILLITDGAVGNDAYVMQLAQAGVRISTVGIGYAAREGLLTRIADASGGLSSLIPNEADLDNSLVDLHRRLGRPFWMGLSVAGSDEALRSPKFWDVWEDVPTTFFGRFSELPEEVEVSGWLASNGNYTETVVPVDTEDEVVYRAWARSRLLDLEDLFLVGKRRPDELVSLSIQAQVLCRFTAFAAIDVEAKVDTQTELRSVAQPVESTLAKKPAMRRKGLVSPGLSMKSALYKPPMGGGQRGGMSLGFSAPPSSAGSGGDLFCDAGGGADGESLFDAVEAGSAGLFDAAPAEPAMELCFEAPAMECFEPEPEPDFPVAESAPPASAPAPAPKPTLKRRSQPQEHPLKKQLEAIVEWREFERLLKENDAELAAAVAEWLSQLERIVDELGTLVRTEQYPLAWKDQIQELMAAIMDFQDQLQEDPIDHEELRDCRKKLSGILKRLT